MLSKKTQLEVQLFCRATVGYMFAFMHNPLYRGARFTWDGFPDLMADQCAAQVHLSVLYSKGRQKQVEDLAADTAREIAEGMVAAMTRRRNEEEGN
jgi:hypothetical protein